MGHTVTSPGFARQLSTTSSCGCSGTLVSVFLHAVRANEDHRTTARTLWREIRIHPIATSRLRRDDVRVGSIMREHCSRFAVAITLTAIGCQPHPNPNCGDD